MEDADDEARLEELRASRAFIELAEHDRAPGGQWSQFTYTQFGIAGDGELIGEWSNKRELWDSFVPAFRDECLLAGEPATEPMWDERLMIPVGVSAAWNETTTEGRGQLVEVNCIYRDVLQDDNVELFTAVLIERMPDDSGAIHAQMDSFAYRESDFDNAVERARALDSALWAWVTAQPPIQ